MERNNYFHILCTEGEKVRYEGRFQCASRKEAIRILREKVGRQKLYGLKYTITEFPIDVLKELIDAIIKKKPIPTGDLIKPTGKQTPPLFPKEKYHTISDKRRDPYKPTIGTVKRRLGGF